MPEVRPIPRLPAVTRDLALWFAADCDFGAVDAAIRALSRSDPRLKVLREAHLFDVYRPVTDSSNFAEASANALLNKEKSLAFRIVLQDTERPLNDEDADAALAAIVDGLEKQCGARLRR